jgi:tetratricopeptide (TPR) repeat protein
MSIEEDPMNEAFIPYWSALIESGELSDEDMSMAHVNRGWGYRHRGENNLALADYIAAIGFDPGNARAYVERGNLFLGQGQAARALPGL